MGAREATRHDPLMHDHPGGSMTLTTTHTRPTLGADQHRHEAH
jgi:hypothetical protein